MTTEVYLAYKSAGVPLSLVSLEPYYGLADASTVIYDSIFSIEAEILEDSFSEELDMAVYNEVFGNNNPAPVSNGNNKTVPEPSSASGLLVSVILGVYSVLHRKLEQM